MKTNVIGYKPLIRTLSGMIAAGGFDRRTDEMITGKRFPVKPSRFTADGLHVVRYDISMETEVILADFRRRGLKAATIESLIAYGANNPKKRRQDAVAALGSTWKDSDGICWNPCLDGNADGTGRKWRLVLLGGSTGVQWATRVAFLASSR
jgi:hypothetical protein